MLQRANCKGWREKGEGRREKDGRVPEERSARARLEGRGSRELMNRANPAFIRVHPPLKRDHVNPVYGKTAERRLQPVANIGIVQDLSSILNISIPMAALVSAFLCWLPPDPIPIIALSARTEA